MKACCLAGMSIVAADPVEILIERGLLLHVHLYHLVHLLHIRTWTDATTTTTQSNSAASTATTTAAITDTNSATSNEGEIS